MVVTTLLTCLHDAVIKRLNSPGRGSRFHYCFIFELPTTQPLETTPLPGSRNKAPSITPSNLFLSALWQRPALWNNIKRTQTPSANSEQSCQIHILSLETWQPFFIATALATRSWTHLFFKLCLYVYKSLNGHAPQYLTDSLKVTSRPPQGPVTRSASQSFSSFHLALGG